MAAFKEESGVERRNRCTYRERILRDHFRILDFYRAPSAPFQIFEYHIRNFPFKQYSLVSADLFRPAGTVTDGVVSKGGDGSMH